MQRFTEGVIELRQYRDPITGRPAIHMVMSALAWEGVRCQNVAIRQLQRRRNVGQELFLDVLQKLAGPNQIEATSWLKRPVAKIVQGDGVADGAVANRLGGTLDSQYFAPRSRKN